jgi:hypothetical protein
MMRPFFNLQGMSFNLFLNIDRKRQWTIPIKNSKIYYTRQANHVL